MSDDPAYPRAHLEQIRPGIEARPDAVYQSITYTCMDSSYLPAPAGPSMAVRTPEMDTRDGGLPR